MNRLHQIEPELIETNETPHLRLVVLVPCMALAAVGWLIFLNYLFEMVEIVGADRSGSRPYFAGVLLVPFVVGAVVTYRKWGVLIGLALGSACVAGGLVILTDPTTSWFEWSSRW